MANIVFNIAKGRVIEYYARVKSNDPSASALIVIPILTAGLESDATLIDKDDLSAFLTGTTDEGTTNGWVRKTLTDADLVALPAPVDASDYFEISLPTVVWTAVGAGGGAISKLLVCYDNDTGAGTDANIIPLTMFDFAQTPSGSDIQMTTGAFFRAT